jgi:hypothetical protein
MTLTAFYVLRAAALRMRRRRVDETIIFCAPDLDEMRRDSDRLSKTIVRVFFQWRSTELFLLTTLPRLSNMIVYDSKHLVSHFCAHQFINWGANEWFSLTAFH